jgi:hypothetical protein
MGLDGQAVPENFPWMVFGEKTLSPAAKDCFIERPELLVDFGPDLP